MIKFGKMAAALAAAIAFTMVSAQAQELKIGLRTEPSSLDPQYHALTPICRWRSICSTRW